MRIIKTVSTKRGNHVHLTVFMGRGMETMAHCGTLIFEIEEWKLFMTLLRKGEDYIRRYPVELVTQGWMPEVEA